MSDINSPAVQPNPTTTPLDVYPPTNELGYNQLAGTEAHVWAVMLELLPEAKREVAQVLRRRGVVREESGDRFASFPCKGEPGTLFSRQFVASMPYPDRERSASPPRHHDTPFPHRHRQHAHTLPQFDFDALDEYAAAEVVGTAQAQGDATPSFPARAGRASGAVREGTGTWMMRRRNNQRKLVLFEGEGEKAFRDRVADSRASAGAPPRLAQPYRFSLYTSNADPTTVHARNLSKLPRDERGFAALFDGSAKGDEGEASAWWLDVLAPSPSELRILSKAFGLHPLTTEDIQLEETREKVEVFKNYYFVCFRSFDQDPLSTTYLEPINLYIVVFRQGTLSFHFRATPHPQNTRRRILQLQGSLQITSDWISYALIDDITDAFGPLIQSIENEADNIDEGVLVMKEPDEEDMLMRIGACRKKVMNLLRLTGSKADVIKALIKRANSHSFGPTSDIALYLTDVRDHVSTSTQNLNYYEKILSRSHSNYLAQISIDMTGTNNQLTGVVSKFTVFGTCIVPMTVITSLWGLNVQIPGEPPSYGSSTSYTWFLGILGVFLGIAILTVALTWRVFVHTH